MSHPLRNCFRVCTGALASHRRAGSISEQLSSYEDGSNRNTCETVEPSRRSPTRRPAARVPSIEPGASKVDPAHVRAPLATADGLSSNRLLRCRPCVSRTYRWLGAVASSRYVAAYSRPAAAVVCRVAPGHTRGARVTPENHRPCSRRIPAEWRPYGPGQVRPPSSER
jgi:hypothetical protein